ncbi:hypothetical protein NC652_007035 [Populus alba x Populus x berolinensis]|nr:hypothetical protein NC652_007035 [Populus alba x Populus x berolinensis]
MQNCKCSFDSAPLHRSTISQSPWTLTSFSFPLSPFPSNLKNHFPLLQSILGETKVNSAILYRQGSIPGLHSWTALLYFQYWETRKACCILV